MRFNSKETLITLHYYKRLSNKYVYTLIYFQFDQIDSWNNTLIVFNVMLLYYTFNSKETLINLIII